MINFNLLKLTNKRTEFIIIEVVPYESDSLVLYDAAQVSEQKL